MRPQPEERPHPLIRAAESMVRDVPYRVTNLANLSALLMQELPDLNWIGFYLMDEAGDNLYLGPFQGKPACVAIPVGRGVCGTAAAQRRTQRVPDVHAFAGHIACDSASASELVAPVVVDGSVVAVLDADSPLKDRFTSEDQALLEAAADLAARHWQTWRA